MKNIICIIIATILVLLTGCSKENVNVEENVKRLVVDQVRFNDRYKWLTVECLSVRHMNEYDSLLTGKLYKVVYCFRHPKIYFYAIKKADSIFILDGNEYFKEPEKVKDIVAFLNSKNLKTEKDVRKFAEIYLRVITSNHSDSLINSIQEIKGLELLSDEGGKYILVKDRAKIYIDPKLIRPLSINRSYRLGSEKIDIFFNTINYGSGHLFFIKISIDDKGTYSSDRICLLTNILPSYPES